MRRNAVLFVAISVLSGFGSTAMSLVAGIWILDLTDSASRAALAGFCVYLPQLLGPWLGGLLDRVPRRPLLIATNLLLAASLLSLLAVRTPAQTWLIFAVSLAYGISYVLLDAGESALLPAALPPDDLGDVNGWRSSAQEGMKLIAPLAGAGLYAWRGGAAVAVLSATMPLAAAVLYAALRLTSAPGTGTAAPEMSPQPGGWPGTGTGAGSGTDAGTGTGTGSGTGGGNGGGGDGGGDGDCTGTGGGSGTGTGAGGGFGGGAPHERGLRAGLSVLAGRRVLRVTVALAAVAIAMSGFATAAQYEVVLVDLGLPATFLGILLSAQGAGSIAGGLIVGRVISRYGVTAVGVTGTALFAAGLLARCLPWWPALIVGAVIGGVGLPWALVAAVTAVQTHTPAALLGRVAATANTVMFGPIALASPLGAAAVQLGARLTLVAAAVLCLTAAGFGARRARCRRAARAEQIRLDQVGSAGS